MNFSFPQFLWALFALSIPIIIHLFNFRKARKIYFSNMDMLRHVKQTSSSKLKLKHWLVLFSRLLALFFLVMAFAQPFIPARDGQEASSEVVVYLDNSQSMSNLTSSEVPGLDIAVGMVQELINSYPRETRFQLVTNDFAPFSNHSKSKVDVEELLTELTYSSIVRAPAEVISRMELGTSGKDVYWISDFAYSQDEPSDFSDTSNVYRFLPIKFPNNANIFIDSAYLETPSLLQGQANKVFVSLRNTGEQDRDDLPVKLFVNDMQVASLTTDLVPNGQTTLSFDLNFPLEEFNRAYLSIDDFPVLFDNEFYLTLNESRKVSILEIKGNAASPSVGRVYGNASLFDLQSFQTGNIDFSRFDAAELLVINEVEQPNSGLIAFISSFLSSGKTVLLIPPAGNFSTDWTQVFGGLRPEITGRQDIAAPDLSNPFFRNIFESTEDRIEMPNAERHISWGNTGGHLLRYQSGAPYLSTVNINSGTLYLLASSIRPEYSSFPNNALFVPIMYKIAVGAKDVQSRLYYTLGETVINVNGSGLTETDLYRLKKEDQEIVPGQQAVGNQIRLDLPRFLMEAGFYDVIFKEELVDVVAFNLEKRESLLKPLPDNTILDLFDPLQKKEILNVVSTEELEDNLNERFQGKELWKYALILALAFLLIEVLLLRFL